ncbi:MAG: DUF4864 domain-containing protein [Arenicellales bacterium]|nr:DUF4864 domain-containing protein [Arenicellales bacterium]
MTYIYGHAVCLFSIPTGALLIILWSFTGSAAEIFPDLTPNPGLSADDVVRIQLGALANNDSPHTDAGIEITYRFASPTNKRTTGPLPRFIAMVKNPLYAPMINHTHAEFGASVLREVHTLLPVVLTAIDGKKVGYLFVLRKLRDEPCADCWMTESVMRIGADGILPTPEKDTGA